MKFVVYALWIPIWFILHSFLFAGWITGDVAWPVKAAVGTVDCMVLLYGLFPSGLTEYVRSAEALRLAARKHGGVSLVET